MSDITDTPVAFSWNEKKQEFEIPAGEQVHPTLLFHATGLIKIISEKSKNSVLTILHNEEQKGKISDMCTSFVSILIDRHPLLDRSILAQFLHTNKQRIDSIRLKHKRYLVNNRPEDRTYRLFLRYVTSSFDEQYPVVDENTNFRQEVEIRKPELKLPDFVTSNQVVFDEAILLSKIGGSLPEFSVFTELMITAVEDKLLIPRELLLSKTRKREVIYARNLCFVISRRVYGSLVSFERIGTAFSNKDHATVMRVVKTVHQNLLDTDREYRRNSEDFESYFSKKLLTFMKAKFEEEYGFSWVELEKNLKEKNVSEKDVVYLKTAIFNELYDSIHKMFDTMKFGKLYISKMLSDLEIEVKL